MAFIPAGSAQDDLGQMRKTPMKLIPSPTEAFKPFQIEVSSLLEAQLLWHMLNVSITQYNAFIERIGEDYEIPVGTNTLNTYQIWQTVDSYLAGRGYKPNRKRA